MCKHKYVKYGRLFIRASLRLNSGKDLQWQFSTWQYGISCKDGSGFWLLFFKTFSSWGPGLAASAQLRPCPIWIIYSHQHHWHRHTHNAPFWNPATKHWQQFQETILTVWYTTPRDTANLSAVTGFRTQTGRSRHGSILAFGVALQKDSIRWSPHACDQEHYTFKLWVLN